MGVAPTVAEKEGWASQATDSSGEWAICWQQWHPCQLQTKSPILNALKLIWRHEKVKDTFSTTILNKKQEKNQYNKELVVCTLYKSHSSVISALQFKVKTIKTLYLDVAWILAASKSLSFNIMADLQHHNCKQMQLICFKTSTFCNIYIMTQKACALFSSFFWNASGSTETSTLSSKDTLNHRK